MSTFDQNKILKSPQDVTRLAERLAKLPEVTRFDDGDHKEAGALADSLSDLENSFREFLDEILPKLAASEGEELYDQVLETAENFRHILYHILEQQKFFRYGAPTNGFREEALRVGRGRSYLAAESGEVSFLASRLRTRGQLPAPCCGRGDSGPHRERIDARPGQSAR